ncbi:YhgE/Pip domain-containing protein [Alteribacter keqinensis]|uniref:ABC-2 type transporter transmembrane domain-containing protein n=1 Tax=Alteribacter keqinensis TaxID=2483800 RepID=A0A3M7TYS5_9BACI|nr:YhgE/Pip domain-containing protein [Alteribacter keqinensis]RNA70052.1 hypothetical protein EBO34_09015 [Alteribacter keqinensis]
MNGLKHELQGILQRKKLLIALIGIMLMPLLYGGVLIWSFWDPYGQIEELPVAVVNEDTGTMVDGIEFRAGDDFIENLQNDPALNFHFVDNETAREGMKNFDFYFYVLIPETFSEDVASVIDSEPVKGTLYYEVNEDYNYVSSQIAGTAIESMENELAEALTLAYIEVANDSFSSFTKIVNELEEGTEKINNGNQGALEGGESLYDAINRIEEGAKTLSGGTSDLKDGVITLEKEWQSFIKTLEDSEEIAGAKDCFFKVRNTTEEIEALLEDGRYDEAARQLEDRFDEAAELEESVREVSDSIDSGRERLQEIEQQVSDSKEELDTIVSEAGKRGEELTESYDYARTFADRLEERFADVEEILGEPVAAMEELEIHYEELPLTWTNSGLSGQRMMRLYPGMKEAL